MNIYVVTEGKESVVYRHWIPLLNPRLRLIDDLGDLNQDCVYIVSAEGYPGYFSIIDDAIDDINRIQRFARLVIAVDSEDMTRTDKHAEISEHVSTQQCTAQIRIVVQHFCFETWALGNRKLIQRYPSNGKLLEYKRLFDVSVNDPELLPAKRDESLNRSQFAEKYLRTAINTRHKNMTYSKSNPQALLHEKYFPEVRNRHNDTGHINSFNDFLAAFV